MGADLLVLDGFTFRKEKERNGRKIWRCTEYKKFKCMARCHTQDGIVARQLMEHNHVPDLAKLEARKKMNDIKERAAATTEATHQIVATASTGTSAAVAGLYWH